MPRCRDCRNTDSDAPEETLEELLDDTVTEYKAVEEPCEDCGSIPSLKEIGTTTIDT